MKKILLPALLVAILAIGAPMLLVATTAAGTAAAVQATSCAAAGAPAAGAWRPPFHQAYAVGSRGFGIRFHPIERIWKEHTGQDLTSLPRPGPVVAAAAGTVVSAGTAGGYGNLVVLDHGGGIHTAYAHLARINPDVRAGAAVRIGQPLGLEGSTGKSTGPHLHFEVRRDGSAIDPIPFMLERGAPLNGVAVAPSQEPGAARPTPRESPPGRGFDLPPPGTPRLASLTSSPAPIPADVKALYVAAAKRYSLPWTLLAGIGMEETAHGAHTATSSTGAQGLMQFMPATWASYGVDGDGDGRADIHNNADSVFSAANYLTASGVAEGADGVRKALFAYNHADWYVNDVLHYAAAYGGGSVLAQPSDCTSSRREGPPAAAAAISDTPTRRATTTAADN
ncbi:M23 family metallopeptidase [Phycicoccus jejuensis]|uniref:peptidoglycan DD-metalloendopeptidase family protein n=1 Tax=Phycicoccus jejuensis TaxID=367299 RepID=UPI00384C96AC